MEKNSQYSTEKLNDKYLQLVNTYLITYDSRGNDESMLNIASSISYGLRDALCKHIINYQRGYLNFLNERPVSKIDDGKGSYAQKIFGEDLLSSMIWTSGSVEKELKSNYFKFILDYYQRSYKMMSKWNHLYSGSPHEAIIEFSDLCKFREVYSTLRSIINKTISLEDYTDLVMKCNTNDKTDILCELINQEIGCSCMSKSFFQLFLEVILDDVANGVVSIDERNSLTHNTQYVYYFGLINLDKNRFEFDIESLKKIIIILNLLTKLHDDQDKFELELKGKTGTQRTRKHNESTNK